MKYVDKLEAKDVMLFARKNLVGNMKGQKDRSLEMFTEKHKAGWLVEHDFIGDSEYKEKEAFLFSDYGIAYLASTPCKERRCEFMINIQDAYAQYMTEKFGEDYAKDLRAERAMREARVAQRAEHDARRQLVQAKMDAYLAKDADKSKANECAEAVRQ